MHFMGVGRHLRFCSSGFLSVYSYNIDICPIGMADPENICIAVGITLLASLGGEIYAFHRCRPQSWILHFRFPPSLVVQYRYMSHWYGRPRKLRYICWNRVAIKCGNGNNRLVIRLLIKDAVLNIPLPFIQESIQENMIEFAVSQSTKNVAWLV